MFTRLLTGLLEVLGIMAGVGLLVFALLRLVPGDPVDAMRSRIERSSSRDG